MSFDYFSKRRMQYFLEKLKVIFDTKVDKVSGKGLSTNDYTTAEKNKLSGIATGAEVNVQSDWNQTTTTADDYIKNKPTIPAAQVNSNWNATSGVAQILNKPTLATVATSGSYNDLLNKPTIPTVNNGTLTITQNGTSKGTFTANQSGNATIALTDTNTHRPIQMNDTEILGNNTTALNLKAGSNVTLSNSSGNVTIAAADTWRPVIDNLTSTAINSSLSANQGRLLANGSARDSTKINLNTNGGIATCSGNGENWWFKICTINITSAYVNRPIIFELSQRGYMFTHLQLMFANVNTTDPALIELISDYETEYYIRKTATSTWEVYGKYSEQWGMCTLHRISGAGANIGITVNMENAGTSTPSNLIRCTGGKQRSIFAYKYHKVSTNNKWYQLFTINYTSYNYVSLRFIVKCGYYGLYECYAGIRFTPDGLDARYTWLKTIACVNDFKTNVKLYQVDTNRIGIAAYCIGQSSDMGFEIIDITSEASAITSSHISIPNPFTELSAEPTTFGNLIYLTGSYNDLLNKPTIPTYNFSGTTFYSGNKDNSEHNANNAIKNGNYYYTSNGPATSLGASTNDGALYVQSHSDPWVGQIAQDYRNGGLYVRGKNNGTWQSWYKVWDSRNLSSKAAAASGTDLSLVTTGEKATWNAKGSGTVTQVKVGSTAYNPSSGVISLPAYPTNTDSKVTQTGIDATYDSNYRILLSGTADNTTRTEGVNKESGLTFNPKNQTLSVNAISSNSVSANIIGNVQLAYGDFIYKGSNGKGYMSTGILSTPLRFGLYHGGNAITQASTDITDAGETGTVLDVNGTVSGQKVVNLYQLGVFATYLLIFKVQNSNQRAQTQYVFCRMIYCMASNVSSPIIQTIGTDIGTFTTYFTLATSTANGQTVVITIKNGVSAFIQMIRLN